MWPLKLTHPISNSHSSIMRPLNRICKKWTATIKTKHYIIQKCVGGRTFWSSRKFFKDSTVLKLISRDTARKSKIFVGIWARCSSSDDDKSLFSCQMTLPVSASRKIIQFLQNTIDSRYINGTTITMKKNWSKTKQLTFGNHRGFFLQDFRLRYHSLFTHKNFNEKRKMMKWVTASIECVFSTEFSICSTKLHTFACDYGKLFLCLFMSHNWKW